MQSRLEPGKARALIAKQESTIQALEARIKDLEAELTTAELSLAHRETLHNKKVERLRERIAIYEPNGEPLNTAQLEDILSLKKSLQEKIESFEQIALERIKVAVIESRLHAKPSFKTLAEKKDDSARKARDEFRNDFIRRLNEEKAELSASLEAEIQKNTSLNKEVGDLRNMIAVLRSDLKKVVQEQVISQRTQNFEGIAPRKASPTSPYYPDDGTKTQYQRSPDRNIVGSRRQRSQNSTQMGIAGSERQDFSASAQNTAIPAQCVPLPPIGGPPANGAAAISANANVSANPNTASARKIKPSPSPYGQDDVLAALANCRSPNSQSPTLCHSVGRGGNIRHQQEVRALKQRLSVLMRSIDDLKDDLKCIIGATLVSIKEAGLHHVITDQSSVLTESERLRFCGCLANNAPMIQALIRLAQASVLPPRSHSSESIGNTKITRRLPLLCTELDTRRLCSLEEECFSKYQSIEPVVPFDK